MYSREFFQCEKVKDYALPEIMRVPLEEVVLQVEPGGPSMCSPALLAIHLHC